MPAKTQKSELSEVALHADDALALVGRGGDRVQQAIQQLAYAIKGLVEALDG